MACWLCRPCGHITVEPGLHGYPIPGGQVYKAEFPTNKENIFGEKALLLLLQE